jgi:hypothetical protein
LPNHFRQSVGDHGVADDIRMHAVDHEGVEFGGQFSHRLDIAYHRTAQPVFVAQEREESEPENVPRESVYGFTQA